MPRVFTFPRSNEAARQATHVFSSLETFQNVLARFMTQAKPKWRYQTYQAKKICPFNEKTSYEVIACRFGTQSQLPWSVWVVPQKNHHQQGPNQPNPGLISQQRSNSIRSEVGRSWLSYPKATRVPWDVRASQGRPYPCVPEAHGSLGTPSGPEGSQKSEKIENWIIWAGATIGRQVCEAKGLQITVW